MASKPTPDKKQRRRERFKKRKKHMLAKAGDLFLESACLVFIFGFLDLGVGDFKHLGGPFKGLTDNQLGCCVALSALVFFVVGCILTYQAKSQDKR
jgi:hypothetical protein